MDDDGFCMQSHERCMQITDSYSKRLYSLTSFEMDGQVV